MKRKTSLRKTWFFDCCCLRCQDPTEMQSYLSGIKCPNPSCHAVMLPSNVMDLESPWICSDCQNTETSENIQDCTNYCFNMLYDVSKSSEAGVKAYEELLIKLDEKLHPNHYIGMKIGMNFDISKYFISSHDCQEVLG